jgi:hypothetical protein
VSACVSSELPTSTATLRARALPAYDRLRCIHLTCKQPLLGLIGVSDWEAGMKRTMIIVVSLVIGLASVAFLMAARRGSAPQAAAATQPFQIGLTTAPKSLQNAALADAQTNACTAGPGSFSVSDAASTTLGAWKTMDAHAANMAAGGGINIYQPNADGTVAIGPDSVPKPTSYFTGDSDAVYAVFLTGTCPGGQAVGARVILNSSGMTIRLDAWQTALDSMNLDQPFSAQFDGQ